MKINYLYINTVKKEILECLEAPNGEYYGDIVRKLSHPSNIILEHIMELKENGYITKDSDGGRFKLTPQ